MTLKVEDIINGCPQFQKIEPIAGRSLLTENRTISALKPTDQLCNRVLLFIQRLFYCILNWLFPFERTPYVGIVHALDPRTADFKDLEPNTLCAYFKRFFETEKRPELQSCADEVRAQYQAIACVEQAAKEGLTDQVKLNKLKEPLKKVHDKATRLKKGEQCLVVCNIREGDELFFLFSKEANGTRLKIIGRGESLTQLSDIQEATIAGQAHIVASLDCGLIPEERIAQLLALTPLASSSSLQPLKDLLAEPLKAQAEVVPDFVTRPNNRLHFLLHVFNQVRKNQGQSAADAERMHLRLELFTLFGYLKEVRRQWSVTPRDVETLKRMLQICSEHVSNAYLAKRIDQTERDALVKELTEVQKSLDQTIINVKRRIDPCAMPSMQIYTLKSSPPLTPFAEVAVPVLPTIGEQRAAHVLPKTPSPVQLNRKLVTAQPPQPLSIPEQLRALTAGATAQQIVHTLFAMPFTPFIECVSEYEARETGRQKVQLTDRVIDPASVWGRFSKTEANDIMQQLTMLSKQLVDFCIQENTAPIDVYEALMKMTAMIAFLTYHQVENGQPSPECEALMSAVGYFMEEVAGDTGYSLRSRFGHAVHAEEAKTSHELLVFQVKMITLQDKRSEVPQGRIERLSLLQNQIDLLIYLTPHHPKNCYGRHGSIATALMHDWIAPLPLPLLAVYHFLKIQTTVSASTRRAVHDPKTNSNDFVQTYRDTPEAIQHDPVSVMSEFTELLKETIASWHKDMVDELERPSENGEEILEQSLYQGAVRKERLKRMLLKQEDYLLLASQTNPPFSSEELTALLSLLRNQSPQKLVMDLIQTHRHLLLHPAVRSFVQLIFFHSSLVEAHDYHQILPHLFPKFFKEKIEEAIQRTAEHPEERAILNFLVQMSERLKGIYGQLNKNTQGFFVPDRHFSLSLLEVCERNPLSPDNVELIALPLKLLLAKEQLNQKEICQIIFGMHLLRVGSARTSAFDRRELFWLNGSYAQLLAEIEKAGGLDDEHIHYLLDKICRQSGFYLDNSPWTGTFPHFRNARYSIDLTTLTVKDLVCEAQKTTLPSSILNDPSFKGSFPDLATQETIPALWTETAPGTRIYFFQDTRKNQCRIEQRGQQITYYRSFPHTGPKLLQALPPETGSTTLPAFLQRPLFFDPKAPADKGYLLSPIGELEWEAHFKETTEGRKLTGIFDLRLPPAERALKQCITCKDLDHPVLKQLQQIENPEHILIWGAQKGNIEAIELPRYGLQFLIRNGALICTTPHYAGYRVRLGASLEERRGFPCSLLLESSDRKRPQKLLLPPADALQTTSISESHTYSGLARLIDWMKRSCLALCKRESSAPIQALPLFVFDPNRSYLKLTCIDLRPHSEEPIFTRGQEHIEQQELIHHAIRMGTPELVFNLVRHVTISKEGKALYSWLDFLHLLSSHKLNSPDAALLLKIADKLHKPLRGRKKYQKTYRKLLLTEENLLKSYVKTLMTLPAPLRLSETRFKEIAQRVEIRSPQEYHKWLAPFFLKIGDTFPIPLIKADGLESIVVPTPVIKEEDTAPVKARRSALAELQREIEPHKPVQRETLKKELNLKPHGLLLFQEPIDLTRTSLDTLLKKVISPKRAALEKEKEKAKEGITTLCRFCSDPEEQLAILSHKKEIASFSDLSVALMQNDLGHLASRLPKGIDFKQLKQALITFYDLEVQLNLTLTCEEEATALLAEKGKIPAPLFEDKVNVLKKQLLYQRQYDPENNPELLAFEASHFVIFRNGSSAQLQLLKQLLESPASIVQASTGSGKSSVLSVLRALMRANGTNLVTQKVLPHLYQDTLTLLQTRLSGTFKRKIYPFRFSQTARLIDPRGRSIFEEIYYNLLSTIKNKGCVLTDYKSYVFLEQKFISLSRIIAANQEANAVTPLITFKHWFYLANILQLLKNRNDELMDEFDLPLSALQRIQTQIREGDPFEKWMIDASLHIYGLLAKQPKLFLTKNLQVDISDEQRAECIRELAETLAEEMQKGEVTAAHISDYLLGKNEHVLKSVQGWDPKERDKLAFYKDQCSTYLPLTLGRAAASNYARSENGSTIVTCLKGQKREAKFGNPIEEINYTIQHYLQCHIIRATLRTWILDRIKDWKAAEDPAQHEEAFAESFPGVSLASLTVLPPDDLEDQIDKLLATANQNPKTVRFFLERHFRWLKTGGMVISMTPQDSVAMSLAVSGVSATAGSLGSLHTQFQRDEAVSQRVQKEMIERAKQRAYPKLPLTTYDPHDPLLILEQVKGISQFCALIDASGAFNAHPPQTIANKLLEVNPLLKRVDYYDENGHDAFVGDPNASLTQTGCYFREQQTRGSDKLLRPDGVALMLTRKKGGIEDFLQEEGRMREEQQRLIVAVPRFDPAESLDALIAGKERYEKQKNNDDRYRAELQRLDHFVRDAARRDLLGLCNLGAIEELLKDPKVQAATIETALDPFLKRFTILSSLFITPGTPKRKSGDYFASNQNLVKCDANPLDQLNSYKQHLQDKCKMLGIVSEALDAYRPDAVRDDLPEAVFPKHAIEKREQEVEEEIENELAQEEEEQEEQEQEQQREVAGVKVATYLPRHRSDELPTPAFQLLHGPFDPRIVLTDSYLPQQRKDPLHKRTPFDDRTERIRSVGVVYQYKGGDTSQLEKIVVGDLLDEEEYRTGTWYNIHTREITTGSKEFIEPMLRSAEFQTLIAQVKFMDGMLTYTPEEEQGLSDWLEKNEPAKMRRYFCDIILGSRPADLERFRTSRLAHIFNQLITA